MKKQGYNKEFVIGLQSSAAILGPIIPPSVLMIIYGSMTDLSIGKLFLAGIAPRSIDRRGAYVGELPLRDQRRIPRGK